jgi:ATP-binding cassette subfamily F protein 3
MILRALATRLIVFDGGKVTPFEGTYDDFLARWGWEEEGGAERTKGPSKKELRKQRAEESAKRRELIGPLEKKMKQLEEEIVRQEQVLAERDKQLIELNPTDNPGRFTELSKERHAAHKRIERLCSELEAVEQQRRELIEG